MSASSIVGTQEIAYRVFAAEFDDASLSYSKSDEKHALNYVVTPTSARLNRTFIAGVLTEVEHVNGKVLRRRIADPMGAFITCARQYQPEPAAYLDTTMPLALVSLAGKAHTYEPDDANMVCSSIRPESINTVDADVCDRWIVPATEATLHHVAVFDEALSMPCRGDDPTRALETRGVDSTLAADVPHAIDHYETTRTYLEVLHEITVQALELVADDRDQVDPLDVAPGDDGDAVLGPPPELDLKPTTNVDIEVGEANAGEIEADADEFEDESDSKPVATFNSEPEFDGGAESEAVELESESEPAAEPDSEPESASNPEPVAAETTAVAENQPGAFESEPASEPFTTVDSKPGLEPTAEPESEPATEPDLASEPEPEPVTDSLDTESEPDFDDGALGDLEDDAPDTGAIDVGSLDDSGSRTLDDFDDGFDDPDPEAGDSTDSIDSTSADADDSIDPDGIYGLDEDERAEVEPEFGTKFISGTDVDPTGEADIDVSDADDLTEQLKDESAVAAESDPRPATAATKPEPAVDFEPEPTPDAASDEDEGETDAGPDAGESAEGIDLEPVVIGAMDDLDDGDGATYDEVVAAIVGGHGADPGAVEDTIQEALLGDRCYEPQDGTLKAI